MPRLRFSISPAASLAATRFSFPRPAIIARFNVNIYQLSGSLFPYVPRRPSFPPDPPYSSRWKSYSAPFHAIRCFPRWTRVTTILTPHVNDILASVKRWRHFRRRNLFQPPLQRFEWSVKYRLEVTYRSLDLLILSFVESRLSCIFESFWRLLKMWIDRIVIVTDL